jgi:DNA-binding NarL/FixJ family response regulator
MGFLTKQSPPEVLFKAVRDASKGIKSYSPTIHNRLQSVGKKGNFPLSAREMQVLQLIAEGLANKQVADTLGISIKTVEKHRQSVMNKLMIHDTAGLTRYAISEGIIECHTGLYSNG